MKSVLDTNVMVKGLIEPRRKKQDHLLREQNRIYEVAGSILDKVYNNEISLIIPTLAIIEVAGVSSRLTGIKSIGIETAEFIESIATQVIDERERFFRSVSTWQLPLRSADLTPSS